MLSIRTLAVDPALFVLNKKTVRLLDRGVVLSYTERMLGMFLPLAQRQA